MLKMLPHSLSSLALEALGQLVSELTRNIVLARVPQHVVKYLEDMIATQVPSNLADSVTDKLLSHILKTFDDLIVSSYMRQNGFGLYMQRCESAGMAALCVARATIHPSTACFNYNCDYEGRLSSAYVRKFMKGYLHHLLLTVKSLKILKLRAVEFDGHLIENCGASLQNLQEFAYNFCTDDILQVLSSVCCRLRILDIRESLGVTNVSVGHILKFRELWSLKITNTNITSQGVTGILKGISQESWNFPTKVNLRLDLAEFKSNFTAVQVSLVPETFMNLVSLELFLTEECNLMPLGSLSRLRNLGLCRYGFPNIPDINFIHAEGLLRDVGHQLEKLKIVNLNGTDLHFIATTCPSIHTLVLQFPDSRRLGFPEGMSVEGYEDRFQLPEFPSVQCLDLKLRNCNLTEYLLSKMQRLRQLLSWWLYNSSESLLDCLVLKMSEGCMQELEVRETKIRVCGQYVVVTSLNGSSVVADMSGLRNLLWKVFKGINIGYTSLACGYKSCR